MVLRTVSGGGQWAKQYGVPGADSARFNDVDAVDNSTAWLAGSNGLLRSLDGGEMGGQGPRRCGDAVCDRVRHSERGLVRRLGGSTVADDQKGMPGSWSRRRPVPSRASIAMDRLSSPRLVA